MTPAAARALWIEDDHAETLIVAEGAENGLEPSPAFHALRGGR